MNSSGTWPDERESLTISVIRGKILDMFSFSSDVGSGSRSQDLDGDCLIILSISTSDKLENESNEQFVLNASNVNGF